MSRLCDTVCRHVVTLCLPGLVCLVSAPLMGAELSETQDLKLPPVTSWPTNGGNLFNQRYSPLDEIDRDNVANLKGVWLTHLQGSGMGPKYSGEAQPIVADGVIYIVTGADDVFALSVDTGDRLWAYQANLDQEISTVCCGWTSRGVGFGAGKVFVGQLDGKLVALDKNTGEIEWFVQAERWQDGYTITSAPLYYDGLVITGFAGAEYATRGRLKAYNADTGELIWTFYTVPGPGEFGHDTWSQDNNVWKYGGGTVWQTPAIDPDLGLIYFSTGNPGPDLNGAVRPGDNLFTASIVALNVKDGSYKWHFQQVHHDLWDYDMASPVVLFDMMYEGRMRSALAQAAKTGWVYILDRVTGEPLIGIEEKPVPQEPRQATSPTQPYPIGESFSPQFLEESLDGIPLVNEGRIFTPYVQDPVLVKPGSGGGANWPASSYDPASDLLYVCARDQADIYRGGDRDFDEPEAGQEYLGGVFASTSVGATGIFAAMDMQTNTIRWIKKWPTRCFSGSAVTGGGIVFTGQNEGQFLALDAATGDRLWEFQTGAGVNAPPSIFEYEGTQYVVIYAAGNLLAGSPRGDRVWLFALNGTLGPVRAADISNTGVGLPDAIETDRVADLERGKSVFDEVCYVCHGSEGQGGHGGTAFDKNGTLLSTVSTIRSGSANMPAFGGQIDNEDLHDVAAYVQMLRDRPDPAN